MSRKPHLRIQYIRRGTLLDRALFRPPGLSVPRQGSGKQGPERAHALVLGTADMRANCSTLATRRAITVPA